MLDEDELQAQGIVNNLNALPDRAFLVRMELDVNTFRVAGIEFQLFVNTSVGTLYSNGVELFNGPIKSNGETHTPLYQLYMRLQRQRREKVSEMRAATIDRISQSLQQARNEK